MASPCPGRGRHWRIAFRTVGLRTPVCVYCGDPNPKPLTDLEWQDLIDWSRTRHVGDHVRTAIEAREAQAVAEPRELTIELPPGLPLLSLNDRRHWAAAQLITQQIKKAAWACARAAHAPALQRAAITVEYQPPNTSRKRDPDNLAPSGKAAVDGLVQAGVLPDDNSEHVTAVRYQIGPVFPRGRVVLRVREVA